MVGSFPKDQVLEWSKLKAIGGHEITVTEKFEFVSGRVENRVENEVNAGNQHFLLFSQCFQKTSLYRSCKVGIVLVTSNFSFSHGVFKRFVLQTHN